MSTRFPAVRDPQTGEMFRIESCGVCGLGHTSPQPVDLGPYYGAQYHGGRHGVTDRMCMARRVGFTNAVAAKGRVLDFGCVDGGYLAAVQADGWDGVGVEIKPEHARAKGLTVFEDVHEAGTGFDVVTLWHCLEHVRSPRETLDMLLPVLKPGGHVIIAVPNWDSLQASIFGRHWFHNDVPRHLSHFTPKALTALFGSLGLEIVKRWNLEIEIDYFGWPQSALNMIMPEPNVLFDTVTQRGRPHSPAQVAVSVALGSVFSVLSLPLFLAATAMGRGAIMVYAVRLPG